MSRSGIGLGKDVVNVFEELKLGKKLSYILYKFDNEKSIVVEQKVDNDHSITPEAQYEAFVDALPENECKYAVYDFAFDLPDGEGSRNKIIFITWSPDSAPVRGKMLCASSKDALRRSLQGIAAEVQGTDKSEIEYNTVLARLTRK